MPTVVGNLADRRHLSYVISSRAGTAAEADPADKGSECGAEGQNGKEALDIQFGEAERMGSD